VIEPVLLAGYCRLILRAADLRSWPKANINRAHATENQMTVFDHSLVTLRFFGDDLVPAAITALLGASPTASHHKSQQFTGSQPGTLRIASTGSWRLSAARREPEDLEAQIFEILDQLTGDLAAWQSLAPFRPNLFCGLS
jgi:hypothetical protein